MVWSGRPHGAELHCPVTHERMCFPCLFHLECCSSKELFHSSFPGTSRPHSWQSRIRAPPCGSGSSLLGTCSFPFPQLPLHWAHSPLPSSDTSFCKNPIISNYLGKKSLKIGFSSEYKVWLSPNILVTAAIHSCSPGSALLLERGVSFKHQTKTEVLTWKKPQIIIELMISCRSHERSISDWIFSLASWCLWTVTLRWNYTCMYRIECGIKGILCFTWNYFVTFPPCLAVRLATWETTEPLSWEYHGIITSWKPELYFLLQVIQSTGDLGHGKCFPWSSAFPNWKRCRAVLIHTCWGSTKKTKQLTSKSGTTLYQAAMLNLGLVTSLIQNREWKWHSESGNKLLSAGGTLGWGLLCSLGDGCCSTVPACFIWESCSFHRTGTWEASWAEFRGCSLNTGRIFWQVNIVQVNVLATITDWFDSSIGNSNGWTAVGILSLALWVIQTIVT